MISYRLSTTSWRFVTTLAVVMAACQRRELADVHTSLNLGTKEEWAFATHPMLSMSADQLHDMTARLFENTGRFQMVSAKTASEPAVAKAIARVIAVETTPSDQSSVVRVRLEYRDPGGDEGNSFV